MMWRFGGSVQTKKIHFSSVDSLDTTKQQLFHITCPSHLPPMALRYWLGILGPFCRWECHHGQFSASQALPQTRAVMMDRIWNKGDEWKSVQKRPDSCKSLCRRLIILRIPTVCIKNVLNQNSCGYSIHLQSWEEACILLYYKQVCCPCSQDGASETSRTRSNLTHMGILYVACLTNYFVWQDTEGKQTKYWVLFTSFRTYFWRCLI